MHAWSVEGKDSTFWHLDYDKSGGRSREGNLTLFFSSPPVWASWPARDQKYPINYIGDKQSDRSGFEKIFLQPFKKVDESINLSLSRTESG